MLNQLFEAGTNPLFFSADDVARQMTLLQQEMGESDAKTHALCGKMDVAAAEQKLMRETAAIIVRNQEKMGIAVRRIEERGEKIDLAHQLIVPQQLSLSAAIAELVKLWDGLVKAPPLLHHEQEAAALKFKRIEEKKESLSLALVAFRSSTAASRRNLLEAAEKADQIQQKVQEIQAAKTSLDQQDAAIVENHGQILEKVQQLQEAQRQARAAANLQAKQVSLGEEGIKTASILGIISTVIQKIIACSAAVILSVGTLLAGIKAYLKQGMPNHRWSATFEMIMQPGTAFVIGVAALAAIRRGVFS